MTHFINMLRDDSGASAAEYALILALVGTGIAIAAFQLGGAITGVLDGATSCIDGVRELADDPSTGTTNEAGTLAC